ncbi:MAG: xanthine dehydrogenase accessory protein XdhC [Bosea sp. (in: a-proteobacteria)]
MSDGPLAPELQDMLAAGEPVAIVAITQAYGSTPREVGATMLVSLKRLAGTIGGGQLEFHAIDMAREMLTAGEDARELPLTLGPHMGQCCGGRVVLGLCRASADDVPRLAARDEAVTGARPTVLIFGAGHTGRALARQMALLPLRVLLIDDREAELAQCDAPIAKRLLPDPEVALTNSPAGSAALIMTHSHALDYRLAEAALRAGQFAYVGMIGSATKRARFLAGLKRNGGGIDLSTFHCPIGGAGVADKRPEIIAALAAADVLRAVLAAPSCFGMGKSGENAA